MKLVAIGKNTLREALRNKIMYSAIAFAAVVLGVSALFANVSIGSQEKVIKDFGLFALSFFGTIISILAGVNLLNKELKQKTIYNILSKPISRWEFILGKHLGLTVTVWFLVAVMGLGLIGFVACFEGKIDWLLFQGVIFVLLEVAVISAVTIFFSSLVVTTTLTGIFALGTYISGRSISYFRYYLEGEQTSSALIKKIVSILDWIIPDLTMFNISNQLVYGSAVGFQQFAYAAGYALCYSICALTLAILIFERRELL